ncbi:hypothetical protein Ccrd_008922 [Cynara cardunculus var. scolymus]|uniref:Uncharacterized protein n=1 Tax=Cynara cardunculus var. scolymus TaxID=59895 RepID=A0A103XE77_CYNCS|nr:hypothetical protein Ccrd_008922 [Cynara cardunculus var. scolymus]
MATPLVARLRPRSYYFHLSRLRYSLMTDMSLKESDFVPPIFRIPRMGRPILTSFMRSRTTKPPPQIKMSPTQLSRQ